MLKYEWIYSQLLTQIQTGSFQAGAKLPSIRQLSQQFSCSKSTILASLKKLEDQHLIYSLPKSGYYVVDHQLPIQPKMKNMDYLKTYELPAMGIKRTTDGIDLDELENIFSKHDIKFFYTMPRLHNPLGTSYSKKEKDAIRKLAYKYNVYIVEDDYLADFEQNTKIDPLFTEDTQDRVIYLKSFSKIMFPGLRIGLAVLPNVLINTFQQYKNTTDIDSSMISQAALELYLKSGMFERYQKKVSEAYASRANQLQQSIATHLAEYQSSKEICMHSHIILPRQVNTTKIIDHLAQQNILLDPINRNYLDAFYRERIIKLNVSNIDESKIDVGIREIALALHNTSNYF